MRFFGFGQPRKKAKSMSAFYVFQGKVFDRDKLKQYGAAAAPTVSSAGGEIALRGAMTEAVRGADDHQIFGLIKFPDAETARKWYHGKAYQALIPLRDEAADFRIHFYESMG